MIPNVPALLAFTALVQSEAAHFIVPLDQSEQTTDWLQRQDIEHDANDLYLVDSDATGCCLVSITDDIAAVTFRLWADENIIGPI